MRIQISPRELSERIQPTRQVQNVSSNANGLLCSIIWTLVHPPQKMFLSSPNYAHIVVPVTTSYAPTKEQSIEHPSPQGYIFATKTASKYQVKVSMSANHRLMDSPFPLYLLLQASLHPRVAWNKGEKSRSSSQAVAPSAHLVARLCVPEAGLHCRIQWEWASTSVPCRDRHWRSAQGLRTVEAFMLFHFYCATQ